MRIREEVGKYIQRLRAQPKPSSYARSLLLLSPPEDALTELMVVAESHHLVRPSFTAVASD